MSPHLLLTYDFPPIGGGIARWMAELAKRYPAGSLVVSTGQSGDSSDVDAGFPNRVDRLGIPAGRLRTIQGILLWSRRVAVLARSTDAEFIWCGNVKPAAYPAKWTMERTGVPYGILFHGGDLLILQHQIHQSAVKRTAATALLSSAAVLVANSEWTRDRCLTVLSELEIDVPEDRVRVVPLGADPAFFRPGLDTRDVRARYGLEDGRWMVSVARLTRHKGIDTALKALARLRPRYPDLRYAVVGSGEEHESLEAEARELGVADRVRFLTDVPDRDLPALYNCAEIYLGVSRLMAQRVEGFGISLAEASACGIPVIAGRSGGIPAAVRDGETGVLVDADGVDPVVEAVSGLLGDAPRRARLGAAGRRAVESHYNWDRVTADLRRIGHELGAAARQAAD
ncbi:MAG TPA: glycosyltransferase family 4 protein [Gemmatimonadales bacterium]|jgi:phosphatidylinositol alpha-1,6-mannosyltransferase|nr:glycosyltransferase family 4 protein [Gemmatimonadales bacterium]